MGIFSKVSPTCQIKNLPQILEDIFSEKTDGLFIEIGGHDGYSWSNTWGLAEIGWKGIYFEPVEELARECSIRHKDNKVKVYPYAVGDFNGMATLFMDADGKDSSCATIDLDTALENVYARYSYAATRNVKMVTLDWILDDIFPQAGRSVFGFEFDLLGIDVEGAELRVLDGLDLDKWRPKMIIIETHAQHWKPEWNRNYPSINRILTEAGYTEIQSDLINSIYVR